MRRSLRADTARAASRHLPGRCRALRRLEARLQSCLGLRPDGRTLGRSHHAWPHPGRGRPWIEPYTLSEVLRAVRCCGLELACRPSSTTYVRWSATKRRLARVNMKLTLPVLALRPTAGATKRWYCETTRREDRESPRHWPAQPRAGARLARAESRAPAGARLRSFRRMSDGRGSLDRGLRARTDGGLRESYGRARVRLSQRLLEPRIRH
jgi:hypothetical protein